MSSRIAITTQRPETVFSIRYCVSVLEVPLPLVQVTDTPTIDVAAPLVMLNGTLAKKFVPVAADDGFDIHAANGADIGTVKSLVWSEFPLAAEKWNAQLTNSPVRE